MHREDIVELGEIVVPAGSGAASFVDTRDTAEVAARLPVAGPNDDPGRDTARRRSPLPVWSPGAAPMKEGA